MNIGFVWRRAGSPPHSCGTCGLVINFAASVLKRRLSTQRLPNSQIGPEKVNRTIRHTLEKIEANQIELRTVAGSVVRFRSGTPRRRKGTRT